MTRDSDASNRPDALNSAAEDSDYEWTREQWENLPSNPTQERLGYETDDWHAFGTLETVDQVLFLPDSEEQLDDAAFVVAAEETLVDLGARC